MRAVRAVFTGCAVFLLVVPMLTTGLSAAPSSKRSRPVVVDRELRDRMTEEGPDGDVAAIVLFDLDVAYGDGKQLVRDAGLTVNIDLPAANAVHAWGPSRGFSELEQAPGVTRLQHPGRIPLAMDTAAWATRTRSIYEETGGADLRIPAPEDNTRYVDGTGVGVAIIDSGIHANHPDLDWCGDGPASSCKTVLNFKVACALDPEPVVDIFVDPDEDGGGPIECMEPAVMQDVPDSDTTSGHGTHVAGISAGDGIAAGDGLYRGVAPGAKLYGFGTGEGLNLLIPFAARSFQWIIDNHADPLGNDASPDPSDPADPPIKVINNSYGGPGDQDPDSVLTRLANSAIDEGITVVWAAGNSAGAGEDGDCTDALGDPVPTCTSVNGNNPTPGNIMVANYADQSTGTRDSGLDTTSSRGRNADPATWSHTWPDVSAPGSFITATCLAKAVCTGGDPKWPPFYDSISGTSMASPHVAGVVALLSQANPSLTPGQIEDILEDTAYKFTFGVPYVDDPDNPGTTSSFDKGHGLVDTRAAVLRAIASDGDLGVAEPATTVVVSDDGGDHSSGSLDLTQVSIHEDPTAKTLRVRWEVAAETPAPTSDPFSYELVGSFDGNPHVLGVTWTGSSVTCSGPGACTASQDGAAFEAVYNLAALRVTRGSPLFDVWARSSRSGTVQDRAPGADPVLADQFPERGQEHVFRTDVELDPLCGPTLPQVVDPEGDTLVTPEPSLDIVNAFLTSDEATDKVVFHTTVIDLDAGQAGLGQVLDFFFRHEGRPYKLRASRDDSGTETYRLQTHKGVTLANVTGAFDDEKNEIVVNVPHGALDPTVTDTSDFFDFSLTTWRLEGAFGAGLLLRADDAFGLCAYKLGQEIVRHGEPVAEDDTATTVEDNAVVIDVLANDIDTSGDDLEVTAVTTPEHGTATINGGETVTYDPAPDFTGSDTFTYTASDPGGLSDTATVRVTVTPFLCPAENNGAFSDDLEPPSDGWTFDTSENAFPSVEWGATDDPFASSPTTSFFSDGTGVNKDDRLISPQLDLSEESHLKFFHRHMFEPESEGTFFDGGVLEATMDGGTNWTDVVSAGATFVSGAYNGRIINDENYALSNREAWVGVSSRDEMNAVELDVGALAGDDVLFRWRLATDSVGGDAGWFVDDISATALAERPEDCNQLPTAAINGPAELEAGTEATFDGSGSQDPDGTIASYSWDMGDGSPIKTGVSVNHTYTTPGDYTVVLTVTDDDDATDTAQHSVTVTEATVENSPPTAAITGPAELEVGTEGTFDGSGSTDTDGTIDSYRWDMGDGTTLTGATVEHAYAAPGDYTVVLTVTDDDDATDTAEHAVTVTEATVENAAPTAVIDGPTKLEAGAEGMFDGSGSTDSDGDVVAYVWDFGDGSRRVRGPLAGHTYIHAGTYEVTLFVRDDDGARDRETQTVRVKQPAPPTPGEGEKAIKADLSGAKCDPSAWQFRITDVGPGGAPVRIHVSWANGQKRWVELSRVTNGNAVYVDRGDLGASVRRASAVIDVHWMGTFSMTRGGPCGSAE